MPATVSQLWGHGQAVAEQVAFWGSLQPSLPSPGWWLLPQTLAFGWEPHDGGPSWAPWDAELHPTFHLQAAGNTPKSDNRNIPHLEQGLLGDGTGAWSPAAVRTQHSPHAHPCTLSKADRHRMPTACILQNQASRNVHTWHPTPPVSQREAHAAVPQVVGRVAGSRSRSPFQERCPPRLPC